MKQKRNSKGGLQAGVMLALLLAAPSAFAACTGPTGNAGDVVYSSTQNVMAYCDNTNWVAMGASYAVGFGTLTTGDFCNAIGTTQMACVAPTVNLTLQASGTLQVAQFPALTGDITNTAGSFVTTIGANKVTMPDIAQITGLSVIGRSANSTGNVAAITGVANQVLMINSGGTALGFGAVNLGSTAAITGNLPVANLNGGASASSSTFWRGDASWVVAGTSLLSGTFAVSQGGTGTGTFTQHGVLVGEATGAVQALAVGATGTVLIGSSSANPVFSASVPLTNLTLSGAKMLSFGTDYSTTGPQANVAINTASSVRYTGASAATFYGIVAGSSGQILYLHNASPTAILTLSDNSTSETTAANKIVTGLGTDVTMTANSSIVLQYDGTAQRWRVLGVSGGTGLPGGASGQVQYNGGGTAFAGDSKFFWDETNNQLTVGTGAATPAATTGTIATPTFNAIPQAVAVAPAASIGGISVNVASTGQMAYYSGASIISGTPDLYVSSTNIAIGTAAASQKLAVNGNVDAAGASAYITEIANDTLTGTTLNKLAKFATSGKATISVANDFDDVVGIVVAGAGASGNAQLAIGGQASCVFDNATIAGDYVSLSQSVNGDCTDSGATRNAYREAIGRVMVSNGSPGTNNVMLGFIAPTSFCPSGTTIIFLTTTGAGSWTVPGCWNNASNSIEVIGGGAGGGNAGSGGGGGGYALTTNTTLSSFASVAYSVGTGGGGSTAGGDTYFCTSASNCGSISGTAVVVGAKGGSAGSGKTGGAGGASASGVGSTKYSGGAGNSSPSGATTPSGGGGAAGPHGNGGAGGAGVSGIGSGGGGGGGGGTNGGNGNAGGGSHSGGGGNNYLGTGGTSSPPDGQTYNGTNGGGGGGGVGGVGHGGDGTDWDASHGSGGAGGGSRSGTGGAGGLYGGAGGGSNSQGAQGLVVIQYTN